MQRFFFLKSYWGERVNNKLILKENLHSFGAGGNNGGGVDSVFVSYCARSFRIIITTVFMTFAFGLRLVCV